MMMSRRSYMDGPRPPFDDGYPRDEPDDGDHHPPDDEVDGYIEEDAEFDPTGGADINCPYCQKIISEDHKQCPHCGMYLSREDQAANSSTISPFLKWMVILVLIATVFVMMMGLG